MMISNNNRGVNFTHTHTYTHTHRFFSVAMALMLVLFGTVGCNEEVQAPEPVVEISPAEALQELKTQFRKENDALAFHLRLHDGNFQSQDLVRSYLSEHFGSGSSAIGSYELAIANASGASFRAEEDESPFTEAAQAQVDYYINAVDGYDDPYAYIGFLEGEFNTYLNSDLQDPTNLGVALWLALQTESVDFFVDNQDLFFSSNSSRIEKMTPMQKCAASIIGNGLEKALKGCIGAGLFGLKIGGIKGAIAGCVLGGSVGFVYGVLKEAGDNINC